MSQDVDIEFPEKPYIWMVNWHQDLSPDSKNISFFFASFFFSPSNNFNHKNTHHFLLVLLPFCFISSALPTSF